MAFQHDFRLCRNLQRDGFAIHQFHLLAAQKTGKLIFRQCVWHGCYGGQDGAGIGPNHSSGGQGFRAVLFPARIMLGPAAMFQPTHQGRILACHLQAIDPQIEGVAPIALWIGPLRHNQRPGDQRRRLTWPAGLDRQARQVDIIPGQHHFLDGRGLYRLGLHGKDLFDQGQQAKGFLESAGGFRLAQEGQRFTHFTQLMGFPVHAPGDTLHRSKQID